ncbi:hypothetical protein TNCV_3009131 [Trichonephila clavipes]|nr:hypothetical protein TNCV_3009131 [Trichonephila clavipes]
MRCVGSFRFRTDVVESKGVTSDDSGSPLDLPSFSVRGSGSLMVKVTDTRPACREFEPSFAEDKSCKETMHVKSVEILNVLPLV